MKVYYVALIEDVEDYDGVWLEKDTKIYATENKAKEELAKLEYEHWEQWDQRRNDARNKWRKKETAFTVLLELGVDAEAVIPYHNRIFKNGEYKPRHKVVSLEVEE